MITTWHDESLDEALSFALDTAYPDPELEQTCHAVVVIALGPRRYAEALHRRLADAAVDHDAKNAPRRLR